MAKIRYHRTDEFWRKEEKYQFLEQHPHRSQTDWQELIPNKKHTWLTEGLQDEFELFLPIGSKEGKSASKGEAETIFKVYCRGVASNNDAYVFSFNRDLLEETAQRMVEDYNIQRDRYSGQGQPKNIVSFLDIDETRLKWIRNTKRHLKRGTEANFDKADIRLSLYRPFTNRYYYFNEVFNEDVYRFSEFLPTPSTTQQNRIIIVPSIGGRTDYWCMMANQIVNLSFITIDANQCFPFYTYNEDGSNRRENITAWALEQFQQQYQDENIGKWDIFHYVYGLLHHPDYRETYAANLRRELPRLPFAPDFWAFAQAGQKLAELHVDYEQQPEYPFQFIENQDEPLNWRVEKMRLSKDKAQIKYNSFLTLAGIPPEVFDYRLGNRSALDWVIDQYRIKTDKRSGITNNPNNLEDEQYIVRLIGQVITVSLETVKIVKNLGSIWIPRR